MNHKVPRQHSLETGQVGCLVVAYFASVGPEGDLPVGVCRHDTRI